MARGRRKRPGARIVAHFKQRVRSSALPGVSVVAPRHGNLCACDQTHAVEEEQRRWLARGQGHVVGRIDGPEVAEWWWWWR